MDYEQATHWIERSVKQILEDTHYEGGKMVEDQTGASGATVTPLRNYRMLGHNAAPDIQLMTLENLRVHSKTQLNRADFEAAYKAVKGAYDAERAEKHLSEVQPDHNYVYNYQKADGLKGGGAYAFDPKQDKAITLSGNVFLKKSALTDKGLVHGRDYEYAKDPYGSITGTRFTVDGIARLRQSGLIDKQTELKDAIGQLLPTWERLKPTPAPTAAPPIPAGPGYRITGTAEAGSIVTPRGTLTYRWNKPEFRVEVRGDTYGFLDDGARALGGQWIRDAEGGFLAIPTNTADRVAAVLPKSPGLAEVLRLHAPTWATAKSSLKQDKTEGVAEGGRWKATFPEPFLRLSPVKGKDFRSTLGWASRLEKAPGKFLARVEKNDLIVLQSDLPAFLDKAAEMGHPGLRGMLASLVKKWQEKPEAKRGTVVDVAWSFSVPYGTISVYVADVRGLKSRVGGEMDSHGGWHLDVSTKNLIPLIKALAELYPRLSEAMARAFGLAAGVVDEEEIKHCQALAALSQIIEDPNTGVLFGGVQYTDIKDAGARAAVEDTRAKLAHAFPAGRAPLPFQMIGITYAKMSGYRCLIGDMPGLGKTIQGIGCLALDPDQLLPALIVAPANVTYNWRKELSSWLPDVPVLMLDALKTPLPAQGYRGVVIASWEITRSRAPELLAWGFGSMIVDEAHKAKNWRSQNSAGLRLIAVGSEKKRDENAPPERPVPHVILLTGTPMKNVVTELHPLLSMLNTAVWGDRKHFASQYEGETVVADSEGEHTRKITVNAEQLRAQMGCFMIRRRKMDALPDLPPKVRTSIYVGMNAAQAEEYYFAKKEFDSWLETAVKKRLVDMGLDPERAGKEAQEAAARALKAKIITQIGKLREMTAKYKVDTAIRIGRRLAAQGESFLYFCDHRSVVDSLEKALRSAGIPYGVIAGGTDAEERVKLTEKFQSGQIRAMICTQAAKEGLTLHRAATNIFVERFWTPADEQQAEDRVHRIGQKRPVSIVFLQVPGTIDSYMANLIDFKRGQVDDTLGDEDAQQEAVDKAQDELLTILSVSAANSPERVIQALFARLPERSPALVEWAKANQGRLIRMVYRALQGEGSGQEEEVIQQIEGRLRKNPRPMRF